MANDAYLELYDSDGKLIEGESTDKHHPKTLQALSYQWGMQIPAQADEASGMTYGKPQFQDFVVTVYQGKATPVLFQMAAKGNHLKKGILYMRKAGGIPQDFAIYTFMELLITNIQLGNEGATDHQVDKITFTYACGHIEYRQQDAKGNVAKSGYKAGWDCKKNAEFTL